MKQREKEIKEKIDKRKGKEMKRKKRNKRSVSTSTQIARLLQASCARR